MKRIAVLASIALLSCIMPISVYAQEVPVCAEDGYADCIFDSELSQEYLCFHIPKLSVNDQALGEFNQAVYTKLYNDVLAPKVYDLVDEQSAPLIAMMQYSLGGKDNIASLLVYTQANEHHDPNYYIFNVWTDNGMDASMADILGLYGISEEEYYNRVKQTLTAVMDTWGEEAVSSGVVEKTLAEENIKTAIPYINASGQLCFEVLVYNMAGPEYSYCIFNTETNQEETEIKCMVDHASGQLRAESGQQLQLGQQQLYAEGVQQAQSGQQLYAEGAQQSAPSVQQTQPVEDSRVSYIKNKLTEVEVQEIANLQQAQSAASQAEMTSLAGQRFEIWDVYLNEIWGVLKEVKSEAEMAPILEAQIAWINQKIAQSEAAAAEYAGGSMYPMVYADTEAELTKARVYYLLELF